MKRFTVKGYAASELEARAEDFAVGDHDYSLMAQWDGTAVTVFDREHADRLFYIIVNIANSLDEQIEYRLGEGRDGEGRRILRAAQSGLNNLASRILKAFSG